MQSEEFRRGAALGFGTGFLAAFVVLLLVASLTLGMFSMRSLMFFPAFFFVGFGKRGIMNGLLLSFAITLTGNALLWLFTR